MSSRELRAAFTVVIVNLVLFIAVSALAIFQTAHHHWIFPIFAVLIALQWAATCTINNTLEKFDSAMARSSLISALLFLLIMGVIRHATILACFDRCAFKLAAASAFAAPVFWAQGRFGGGCWWGQLRSNLAAMGAATWALYLALTGLHLGSWIIDIIFAIVALLFWLGRTRADFLVVALGIAAGILIRESASEIARIGLGVVWGAVIPLAAVERIQAWLDSRPRASVPPPRPARVFAFTAVLAGLLFYIVGPVFLMTDRAERQIRLAKLAPAFPIKDPKMLSPLAARLRGHVIMLAQTIGERDAFSPKAQVLARDYVYAQFAEADYKPKKIPYGAEGLPSIKNGFQFDNVEAVLPAAPADQNGVWIVGAHYDSAPGTSGADDNASAVAVLIEAARLMKARRPARDIRFVAFGTEEPPSFGTRNMGSSHYAHAMRDNGVKVHAMISLEMLG
ncbi:MAG: M28 family peptidase, partial [Elusimicrobiota bacterium]